LRDIQKRREEKKSADIKSNRDDRVDKFELTNSEQYDKTLGLGNILKLAKKKTIATMV
jgi:hypothetical protein